MLLAHRTIGTLPECVLDLIFKYSVTCNNLWILTDIFYEEPYIFDLLQKARRNYIFENPKPIYDEGRFYQTSDFIKLSGIARIYLSTSCKEQKWQKIIRCIIREFGHNKGFITILGWNSITCHLINFTPFIAETGGHFKHKHMFYKYMCQNK